MAPNSVDMPSPREASTRALLRRIDSTDASAVLDAFLSDPDMSRQGDVTDLRSAQSYIQRMTSSAGQIEVWAIAVEDVLTGLVRIDVDHVNRNGWFSYWMNAEYRGFGLGTRAAATVADWALSARGLQRLELGHRVNNPASGAVARAAGFIHEGTLRAKFLIGTQRVDVLTYGRLRTDSAPPYEPLRMIYS